MSAYTRLGLGDINGQAAEMADEAGRGVYGERIHTECDPCGSEATAIVHLRGELNPTRMCSKCHWEASEEGAISNQHVTVLLVEEPRRIGVRELDLSYLDLATQAVR
jgi:hypothetical protein